MEILNHPLCTQVIGAPSDMPEPACAPLPIAVHTDADGQWAISFWMPDASELAMLNAGGCVALHVRASGRQHPVVGVNTCPAVKGVVADGDCWAVEP